MSAGSTEPAVNSFSLLRPGGTFETDLGQSHAKKDFSPNRQKDLPYSGWDSEGEEDFPTNLPTPISVAADSHPPLPLVGCSSYSQLIQRTHTRRSLADVFIFWPPCSPLLHCHGCLSSPLMEFGTAHSAGCSCAPLQSGPLLPPGGNGAGTS